MKSILHTNHTIWNYSRPIIYRKLRRKYVAHAVNICILKRTYSKENYDVERWKSTTYRWKMDHQSTRTTSLQQASQAAKRPFNSLTRRKFDELFIKNSWILFMIFHREWKSYLLTNGNSFREIEIKVKVCTNKECKDMHQVWPIDMGKCMNNHLNIQCTHTDQNIYFSYSERSGF